jgi:hypothetical protein
MSRRYCTETVPARLIDLWQAGFGKLHGRELQLDEHGLSRPVEVSYTPEALECFVAWYDANAAEAESDQMTKSLGQAWGKMTVYACRFALMIEQLRWAYESAPSDGVRPVGVDSLEKAIRLVDYFKSHARRAHALMRGGPTATTSPRRSGGGSSGGIGPASWSASAATPSAIGSAPRGGRGAREGLRMAGAMELHPQGGN